MKTEDLIKALSGDTQPVRSIDRAALWAGVVGAAGALALFLAFIGFRTDLTAALATWRFDLKLAVAGLAVVVATLEFRRLLRPGQQLNVWPVALVAGALVSAVLLELILLPSEAWRAAAIGKNSMHCLQTILFLSAWPLAGALWAMRSGAPTSPSLAGAAAGGVAAAFGALLYATHCNDDSPLFVAIWYSTAIAMMIAAGSVIGRYVLRW